MNLLGISCVSHDAGVALLESGTPTLVLEEERLNREKHTKHFPEHALGLVFGEHARRLAEFDAITIPWDVRQLRRTYLGIFLRGLPGSLHLMRDTANTMQPPERMLWQTQRIRWGLSRTLKQWRLPPIINVAHHDSHAAFYFVSPFEEASVLVMDGYGDVASSSGYAGHGNRLERLWHNQLLDSLGILYTLTTRHLGFEDFEEGTVMALAACGGPTYDARFSELVKLGDEGRYVLDWTYLSYDRYGMIEPFTPKFHATFGPPRRKGEALTDHHRDLAHALQATTENVILHVARDLHRRRPSRNLVMTGGVALNCVANARIKRDTPYEHVWVPPCASDTGVPLGSALWHYHATRAKPRTYEMTHAFLGAAYSDAQIETALRAAGLPYERLPEADLIARVARNLAEDRIVGWFQGRFEIGPRALGNRSILASPLTRSIKETINARIKYREPFRPFAPAVLAEHQAEYFEIDQPDPFMTMAPRVRADKVDTIPAAVHVDGTGRIQTVTREANPLYYALIKAFKDLTGVPVLLNTSFNKQEPIVARPEEAISCYLRTEMDVLVLGNYYTRHRTSEAEARARKSFAVLAANTRGGE